MRSSLALWIFSITPSSSFAIRRASSSRHGNFFSALVHWAVLARILSNSLQSMRLTSNTKLSESYETCIEIRDRSSAETDVGSEGVIDELSASTVFCTNSTTSPMPSSFSRAVYPPSGIYLPGRVCWTYLHNFNGLGHSGDSCLWAPERASIEALLP
jgi:hypothetical protein